MLYCFDNRLPFDYSKLEMALSKKNGNGILYDNEFKKFTDFEGNIISITGKLIFPRTGVEQIYEMNDQIVKQGGIPVVSNGEIDMIEDWSKHYSTNRKTKVYKGRDLIGSDVILELERNYGKEIFIKTKKKNFSSIIPVHLLSDTECAFYKALSYHLDEDFIVSEKVDIIEDEYGKKEYRCFVVNNQVYNISRFTVDVFHKIDGKVLKKAEEIVKSLEGKFPNYYVLDLFEYQNGNITYVDVVEINPIHSSGLYLYNSVIEKSNDFLHTNLRKVSNEFIIKIDECSIDGCVINDRESSYDVCNSFAGDLRSICLTGDVGLMYSSYTNLSVADFGKHTKKHDFDGLEIMTDDDLLKPDDQIALEIASSGMPQDVIDKIQKMLVLNKK